MNINHLEQYGYMIIKLDTSEIAARQSFLKQARSFFSLPMDTKLKIVNHENLIGFRDQGIEYSADPTRPDLMQAFSVSLGLPKALNHIIMPDLAIAFERSMQLMANACEQILRKILILLTQTYQIPWSDTPSSGCEQSSFFQCNFYQPQHETRELLQDLHDDGTLFTFLYADAPGLEGMCEGENNCAPIKLNEDELLIFAGGVLSILTQNRIKPFLHRVKNVATVKQRYSYMYFVNPSDTEKWPANLIMQAKQYAQNFGLPKIQ